MSEVCSSFLDAVLFSPFTIQLRPPYGNTLFAFHLGSKVLSWPNEDIFRIERSKSLLSARTIAAGSTIRRHQWYHSSAAATVVDAL